MEKKHEKVERLKGKVARVKNMSVMLDGTKVSASLHATFFSSLHLFLRFWCPIGSAVLSQPLPVSLLGKTDCCTQHSDWITHRCALSSTYSDTNTHTPDSILNKHIPIWNQQVSYSSLNLQKSMGVHCACVCVCFKKYVRCGHFLCLLLFWLLKHLEKQAPSRSNP